MSDTHLAPAADVSGAEDDGFSPEERVQFAEMMQGDGGLDPAVSPPVSDAPPPAAGLEHVPGPNDDEDEDDEADAAAAGAPGAAADGAQPGGAKPKKRVSYGKFARSEEARVRAETDAAQLRQTQARLDERLKIINEALATPPAAAQAPKVEEDVEPDPEADVFGWIAWSRRQRERDRAEINEVKTSRAAETEEQQVANTYVNDARRFAATEPNFAPAYQFLMANRTAELAQFYFGKDLSEQGVTLTQEEQARCIATIAQEEKMLVKGAIQAKQSPADRVFRLAKARGYRPAAPAAAAAVPALVPAAGAGAQAAAAVPAVIPGSLAAPPAAAGAPAAPSVKDEIDRIKAGSEAAKSLSSGGGAPATPLTAEKLANMSEAEFNRMVETMPPEQLRALMGE